MPVLPAELEHSTYGQLQRLLRWSLLHPQRRKFTDNTPLPQNSYNYRWDFGDGTTGEGKIISHTYASAGTFRVHLVVYDSGGQTDVVWKNANPL